MSSKKIRKIHFGGSSGQGIWTLRYKHRQWKVTEAYSDYFGIGVPVIVYDTGQGYLLLYWAGVLVAKAEPLK